MSELSQERRNINASNSRAKAVKALTSTDFSRYMGSGFNIKITRLDGTLLTPEFVVNGEDMTGIAPHIVDSLKESLKLHRQLLLSKLKEVEEAIG